jgi:hypothetical protein
LRDCDLHGGGFDCVGGCMSQHHNTLAHIQEIYFDVCSQLNGESHRDMGYDSKREMLKEFKWKLERIEEEFKTLTGVHEDQA